MKDWRQEKVASADSAIVIGERDPYFGFPKKTYLL
jgi:hypothetical protein